MLDTVFAVFLLQIRTLRVASEVFHWEQIINLQKCKQVGLAWCGFLLKQNKTKHTTKSISTNFPLSTEICLNDGETELCSGWHNILGRKNKVTFLSPPCSQQQTLHRMKDTCLRQSKYCNHPPCGRKQRQNAPGHHAVPTGWPLTFWGWPLTFWTQRLQCIQGREVK